MTDADTPKPTAKMADLKVRTLSSIVMLAVAGTVLWAGGWVFAVFVGLIALGLLWEWWGLISKFNQTWLSRALWMLGGVVYIGGATCLPLILSRFDLQARVSSMLCFVVPVVATDVGAFLIGRFVGGPLLAESISPQKTWAGFVGGLASAVIALDLSVWAYHDFENLVSNEFSVRSNFAAVAMVGVVISVIVQSGDLFESWLKRRANVKDSGQLIPGHGGLFDRLDGYVALLFVVTMFFAALLRHNYTSGLR